MIMNGCTRGKIRSLAQLDQIHESPLEQKKKKFLFKVKKFSNVPLTMGRRRAQAQQKVRPFGNFQPNQQ